MFERWRGWGNGGEPMADRIPLIPCWVHHHVLQAALKSFPLAVEATEIQCLKATGRWFVGEPQISVLNSIFTGNLSCKLIPVD